jgi:hypothetical protein
MTDTPSRGVVAVNFDILEAWYGQTDGDEEFLRRQYERSMINLAIPFATLVPLTPTTWLTAVKHESSGFFQLNKDPRVFFWKKLRFCETPGKFLDF